MILNLIADLIRAIAAYFDYRNKSFAYDILEKSLNLQSKLRNEIENLRNQNTNESNDRADNLLLLFKQEQQFFKYLSTTYSTTSSKQNDTNK
jgi:predicted metal-dependent enzyme (double-stranded beta helix superfamily)